MICFNCGKCFKTDELATFIIQDECGNTLKKVLLCQECAKQLAIDLFKGLMDEKEELT